MIKPYPRVMRRVLRTLSEREISLAEDNLNKQELRSLNRLVELGLAKYENTKFSLATH